MTQKVRRCSRFNWAQFRFSVIGPLLVAPPKSGDLKGEVAKLAARTWCHPSTDDPVRFSASTIERWYYRARNAQQDPIGVLRRRPRRDAGRQKTVGPALAQAIRELYAQHPSWTAQLLYDNLTTLAETEAAVQPIPSYTTIRRYLRTHGLDKRRRLTSRQTDGARRAEARLAEREVRSYEDEHVGALFHWDFHHGSRKILTARGEWKTPILLGILDDRSRLACHVQWYLAETAENVAHGMAQALQKRGMPRAAMSDNGSPMVAAEITEGLARLGILHQTTLPYSPYQNGKQESFWGQIEGRLLPMLEGVADLTLTHLNQATQAWVEYEYNRSRHSELNQTPLERFLAGPEVLRRCPDSAVLKLAFTRADRRTVRKSDGTIVVLGKRFEVPNQYRHLRHLDIRYAEWDLSKIHLADSDTDAVLCPLLPQDKAKNATGQRRCLEPSASAAPPPRPAAGIAPRLASLINRRADTGLPSAYLPKDEDDAS